jgi:hypothetical protein
MAPNCIRVASRYRQATRPIPLPEMEIKGLARHLAKKLRARGLPKPKGLVTAVAVTVPHVKGHDITVEILVVGSESFRPNFKTQNLIQGGYMKPRRGQAPLIVVFVNPFLPRKTFIEMVKRGLAEKEIYRILAHELTHAADVIQGRGSVGDKGHHHNHPAEVKALMRDVVTTVEPDVRGFLEESIPFKDALQMALADSKWEGIKEHLTPRNRKTILKGVYTHLRNRGLR